MLDSIVGHAFAKDENEVRGYYWIWGGWVNSNRRTWNYYWRVCDHQGGDLQNFGTAR